MSYAYFAIAFIAKDNDKEKAKANIEKSLALNPTYADALALQKALNQQSHRDTYQTSQFIRLGSFVFSNFVLIKNEIA